ncbi:MAG: Na+/H+ antiporter subunit E [Candidatus Omnitrophica bacterium]|nr:Na+/H+ antiporter subunit E [Candidatus Omnitrophota bacterium]
MIAKIFLFILWFLVWIFLSWPINTGDVIMAALVSLFVCYMINDLLFSNGETGRSKQTGLIDGIRRLAWFLYYVVVFVWECVKANFDVAYRVIHPDMPIRPGSIKVKTGLKSDIGLTFLASSITLTPGTTTIDIDKEKGIIYVHLIHLKNDYDPSSMRLAIVEKFEKILRRVFE